MHEEAMRPRRAWLPGLAFVALSCMTAGTPRADQDAGAPPREIAVVALASVTATTGGGQVTPLREPQIVTARLAVPASPAALAGPAETASVGPMLWALAAMIGWIAARRR